MWSSSPLTQISLNPVQEFLILDYSVLLSDIDVIILKNPFQYLYRDRDVEGMSDGFDEMTAFGK